MKTSGKILIVDDDIAFRALLKLLLNIEGHEVRHAVNPIDAFHILEEEAIDLIVTELMLPMMDGIRFIDWVKKELETDIPILVITALDSSSVAKLSGSTLWNALLYKPVFKSDIMDQLTQLISNE